MSAWPARSYAERSVVPSIFYKPIARAWAAGHDSAQIAKGLNLTEADVCRVLASFQDRRHAERKLSA